MLTDVWVAFQSVNILYVNILDKLCVEADAIGGKV